MTGVVLGLLVSAIVVAGVLGVRRQAGRWRLLGVFTVLGLILVILGVVPGVVRLTTDLAVELQWKYGWSTTHAALGAGTGAVIGSLAGAITTWLICRCVVGDARDLVAGDSEGAAPGHSHSSLV